LEENDKIFVVGDFNRSSLKFVIDEESKRILPLNFQHLTDFEIISTFYNFDCHQINTFPNDKDNYLDLVFTNTYDGSIISPASFSDNLFSNNSHHKALVVNYPFSSASFKKSYNNQMVYDFGKANYDEINNVLRQIEWNNFFRDNIELNLSNFYSFLYSVIDIYVPKSRKKDKRTEPWLDKNLRSIRNQRNKLYKKIKYLQVPDQSLLASYNILANEFKLKSNEAYLNYVNSMGNSIICNPKKFFDFVNMKRKCYGYPITMSKNGSLYSCPKAICNIFADNFQSIYCRSFDFNNNIFPSTIANDRPPFDIAISILDITSNIMSLNCQSDSGPDLIPPLFLIKCVENLVYPLSLLFNQSLAFGVFPSLWKSSYVIPIYKNGDKTLIDNYRGIAMLSTIPKLFEKIIVQKLTPLIDPLLNEQQHGFRSNRSTTTNLMVYTSSILCDMENGLSVDAIYTDFSKAFDKVDHNILIYKLAKFGLSGSLLDWVSSYLKDRTQIVKFQGHFSDSISVTSGVPQGSHLGPLLFNIFISDLSSVLNDVDHLFFADDLKIYAKVTNIEDAFFLQNKLNNLLNWCSINKLILNVDKCKVITFSRKKRTIHFDYLLNGSKLSRVAQILDLGILLDEGLFFSPHYEVLIGKANQMLGFIKRRAKEFKNVWVAKTLYCSLVRSMLEYGSIIWHPIYDTHSISIESIQKRFLLFALRDQFDPRDFLNLPSYEYRLNILNLTPLSHRRETSMACFAFDVLTGKINVKYISDRVRIHEPVRFTRNPKYLIEHTHRTDYAMNEPINRCCRTFNLYSHIFTPEMPRNLFKRQISQPKNMNHAKT